MVKGLHDKVTEFNIKPAESWFCSVSQCFFPSSSSSLSRCGRRGGGLTQERWMMGQVLSDWRGQRSEDPVVQHHALIFSCHCHGCLSLIMAPRLLCLLHSPLNLYLASLKWWMNSFFYPLHLPSWPYFLFFLTLFFLFNLKSYFVGSTLFLPSTKIGEE